MVLIRLLILSPTEISLTLSNGIEGATDAFTYFCTPPRLALTLILTWFWCFRYALGPRVRSTSRPLPIFEAEKKHELHRMDYRHQNKSPGTKRPEAFVFML